MVRLFIRTGVRLFIRTVRLFIRPPLWVPTNSSSKVWLSIFWRFFCPRANFTLLSTISLSFSFFTSLRLLFLLETANCFLIWFSFFPTHLLAMFLTLDFSSASSLSQSTNFWTSISKSLSNYLIYNWFYFLIEIFWIERDSLLIYSILIYSILIPSLLLCAGFPVDGLSDDGLPVDGLLGNGSNPWFCGSENIL